MNNYGSNINLEGVEFRDPDKVTTEILGFLTAQNEIASKQFITSRNLIIGSLIVMVIQIFIAVYDISKSDSKQNNLATIIELQIKQSEKISNMSLNLISLQNQAQTLEQENAQLNRKILKLSKIKK